MTSPSHWTDRGPRTALRGLACSPRGGGAWLTVCRAEYPARPVGSATQRDGEWKRSRSRPDHIRTPWRERSRGSSDVRATRSSPSSGAGALNQAIKALAITIDHVAGEGMDPVCIPSFTEVDIDGTSAHCDPAARGGSQPWRRGDRAARRHRPSSPRRRGRRFEPRLHGRRSASSASWGVGGLIDA